MWNTTIKANSAGLFLLVSRSLISWSTDVCTDLVGGKVAVILKPAW